MTKLVFENETQGVKPLFSSDKTRGIKPLFSGNSPVELNHSYTLVNLKKLTKCFFLESTDKIYAFQGFKPLLLEIQLIEFTKNLCIYNNQECCIENFAK